MLTMESDLWRQGFLHVAGVDEAGRGPLAGPVVAAAVIFPPYIHETYGIQDSKALSSKRRRELVHVIRAHALAVGLGIVEHDVIDRINILQATLVAMRLALTQIPLPIDYVLVDGNRAPLFDRPCRTVIKGDSRSLSIAAASIIAKVARDDLMLQWHEKFPQYSFDRHKGYPTAAHLEAVRRYGLSPIHRRSFHPKKLAEPC